MKRVAPLLVMAGAAAALIASMRAANASLGTDATPQIDSVTPDGVSVAQWSEDIDTLARTAWAENRGGGSLGMQSVINVILNRLAYSESTPGRDWWGNTIQEICKMRSGSVYQFSCWNPADPNYSQMVRVDVTDSAFNTALQLATMALAGQLPDITHGSTHYYAPAVVPEPFWARGQQARADIAGQLFYAVA